MLILICVQSICIILLLWHKYSAPLQHQLNWCQPPIPVACRPSRANVGAPVLAARPQLLIRLHYPVPMGSTRLITPVKTAPPSHIWTNTPSTVSLTCHFKPFSDQHANPSPVSQSCHSSTDYLPPPSHFRTDTPSQYLWDSPVVPQHITFPFNLFLNQHAKPIPVRKVPLFLMRLPALLLQVELLPHGTKRKSVIRRLSQQRHHYLTC